MLKRLLILLLFVGTLNAQQPLRVSPVTSLPASCAYYQAFSTPSTFGLCLGGVPTAVGTGTGTISSGTTNRISKYTGATTLGNSGLSDDGTTISTTEFITVTKDAIATTQTAGFSLLNTTAATVGVPRQFSPYLFLSGTARDTDGAASLTTGWKIDNQPLNGNIPQNVLKFFGSHTDGSYKSQMELSTNDGLLINCNVENDGGFVSGTGCFGAGPSPGLSTISWINSHSVHTDDIISGMGTSGTANGNAFQFSQSNPNQTSGSGNIFNTRGQNDGTFTALRNGDFRIFVASGTTCTTCDNIYIRNPSSGGTYTAIRGVVIESLTRGTAANNTAIITLGSGDIKWGDRMAFADPINFADADTTPTVGAGTIFKTACSSGCTITDFDDGRTGQIIIVHCTEANTIIDDGTPIKVSGGDFTCSGDDTISFYYDGTAWFELSRSVN